MGGKATVAPITGADLTDVGAFMSSRLNPRVSATAWSSALTVPWHVDSPNHGFLLRDPAGQVAGAYLAYYSRREVAGEVVDVCNLGAWCVDEEHRFAGVRLLTAVVGQPGYHFTDLSPSGNVIPLNRKLKFVELDTRTDLVPHLLRACSCRISFVPERIDEVLEGKDRELWEDHRNAAAAIHAVVTVGRKHCYVMVRKDTRRRVRAFSSVLHVGNRELFHEHACCLGGRLLRHGCAATLVERHVSMGAPRGARPIRQNRPKMFRSPTWTANDVDYLYSELTCLKW